MKIKLALIALTAAMSLVLAINPAYAGKVLLENNHQQNAYAIRVTLISAFGQSSAVVCAAANEEHEVRDAVGAVSKIVVFKVNKFLNGKPDRETGPVLKEYDVPNKPDIKRTFTAAIGQDGGIRITEP